jgi:hypothetical protein
MVGKTILKTALSMCLLSSALYLTGCNSGTPKCNASETKDLVIKIAKDELKKEGAASLIPKLKFEVINVRTLKHNKDVDSYKCAADFQMKRKNNGTTKSLPITYTVESADDGDKFYVTVYGLK